MFLCLIRFQQDFDTSMVLQMSKIYGLTLRIFHKLIDVLE